MTDPHKPDANAPPSGSAQSAVEAPSSPAGRKMLLTAAAFVLILFVVFLLIPGGDETVEETPAVVSQ
ncbi:hypothetical protein [uncultured Jannaschia sp.]|uniref:hypothetical protein n=1 Tax=Jannaschia halovivens TaxID=3388667 RepID=UPI00260F1722|nr:hypothetical protein [uncultured Jannaschia sp.]